MRTGDVLGAGEICVANRSQTNLVNARNLNRSIATATENKLFRSTLPLFEWYRECGTLAFFRIFFMLLINGGYMAHVLVADETQLVPLEMELKETNINIICKHCYITDVTLRLKWCMCYFCSAYVYCTTLYRYSTHKSEANFLVISLHDGIYVTM